MGFDKELLKKSWVTVSKKNSTIQKQSIQKGLIDL